LPIVALLAACAGDALAPGQGHLRLSFTMSGLDLDPDGAYVTVDDTARVAVRTDGAATLDLQVGVHTAVLDGLVGNCAVDGGATRELEVRGDEITDVVFQATCGAATGVVEVTVHTQGVDPDADGYLVSVDHVLPQRILDGTVGRFAPITGGVHVLQVDDVADNCLVSGGTPVRAISVATGAPVRDTVRVAVSVACVARPGTVRVITSTSGTVDADGYVVDFGLATLTLRPAANDTLAANLPAGTYDLRLSDVADHCQVTGELPSRVTIVTDDTAEVRFAVRCETLAVLRVAAPTTGSNPDPVYIVQVDSGGYPLLRDSTLSLGVRPGAHVVELTDIAGHCVVDSPNPVPVSAARGAVVDIVFLVTCGPFGSTGVDVTITTAGNNPDRSYIFNLCTEDEWDCYAPSYNGIVPANATFPVDLAPGSYYTSLYDVAPNCRARWSGHDPQTGLLIVTAGERKALRIDVTCVADAQFVASVTTTGSDRQSEFRLTVDEVGVAWLTADSTVTASVVEGVHAIGLANIQENCRATSPNPVTVTLVPGVLTPVRFAVDCQPFAVLEVAVHTTGNNLPPGFAVGLDPDWLFGDGYAYSTAVTPNGTVTLKLNLGEHSVWLDQVPANCSVDGANPLTVNARLGTTIEVAFAVACR
jgi:hypothetical protein